MAMGQLVSNTQRAAFAQRMRELARGVEIIVCREALEVAGAGWRVRRVDACTLHVVLDDFDEPLCGDT